MSLPDSCDVCVIGGGPAGLSASIALAQTGFSVVVLDSATPPIDKACGEGLMPDSVRALADLGITIPYNSGFRFRGIRFADAHSEVSSDFPTGTAVGLRRTVLHSLLATRAQDLGVRLIWGARKPFLSQGGVSADGRFLKSRFIVGADGQKSRIRQQAGLDRIRHERSRYGFRKHYRVAPWSPYMELHWGPKCQVYITPVSDNEVCVALISRSSRQRLDDALEYFPSIREKLSGAVPVSSELGALSVSRSLRNVRSGNVALVGDASGSVDAITGEGMCLAFQESQLLAQALASGSLNRYEQQHRALLRRPRLMASLMLTLDSHRKFQQRALASLSQHPEVFGSLLAVHVGERRFTDLVSWHTLNLCRAFLAA